MEARAGIVDRLCNAISSHVDDVASVVDGSGFVQRFKEEFLADRARRKRLRDQRQHQQDIEDEHSARQISRHEAPAARLSEALGALVDQWLPETGELLFGGIGIGRSWMRDAIAILTQRHGCPAAHDIAEGLFQRFAVAYAERIGDDGLATIRAILDQHLPPRPQVLDQSGCTQDTASAILPRTGPQQHLAPEGALSSLPARPGGT